MGLEAGKLFGSPCMEAVAANASNLNAYGGIYLDVFARQSPLEQRAEGAEEVAGLRWRSGASIKASYDEFAGPSFDWLISGSLKGDAHEVVALFTGGSGKFRPRRTVAVSSPKFGKSSFSVC
jgi:hypothetical protein